MLAVLAIVQIGGYVSLWKALAIIAVLFVWVKVLAWMDKDAPIAHLPREALNAGMMLGLIIGYGLFFMMPGFLPALGVLLLMLVIDIATYLIVRQRVVGLADLTKEFAESAHQLVQAQDQEGDHRRRWAGAYH